MNKTKHITQEGGGMNLNDTHGVKAGGVTIHLTRDPATGEVLACDPPGVTVDETIDYYGMPFKEARERILAMPAEEARGMAISLLIQNGLLRKNAAGVPAAETQQEKKHG